MTNKADEIKPNKNSKFPQLKFRKYSWKIKAVSLRTNPFYVGVRHFVPYLY